MNLVLITPNINAATESFIQEHISNLNPIKVITGGYLPCNDAKGRYINSSSVNFFFKTISFFFRDRKKVFFYLSISWFLLKNYPRKNVVILIEYGTVAHSFANLLEKLKMDYYVHFHGYDASVFDFANYNFYEHVIKSAKGVFAVSNEMRTDLLQIGFSPKQIYLNPYGPRKIFKECVPEYNSKLIFSMGRFVEKKAPYNIVLSFAEVLKSVPEAKLIMAGEGPLLDLCVRLSKSLGIQESISFVGSVTSMDTIRFFNICHIFVQHSVVAHNGDKEGLPLAILEAQLASIPVIATAHSGIPDLIKDGINGFLIQENDIASFAKKIVFLLNNPTLAREMGACGKAIVEKSFTIDNHISKISKIIYGKK